MSRLINRLSGRVYGWFDAKDARPASRPLPARFRNRARLALLDLEKRLVPNTYTVTNANDANSGSGLNGDLRFCMNQAIANPGPDTIVFDSTFSTGVNVIALTAALPTITGSTAGYDLTITGPGADHLVITRAAAFDRPILLSPTAAITTMISGMTLTGFSGSTAGGAIGVSTATTLVLDGVQIIGNTSSVTSGGIDIGAATNLTIRNSTIAYNSATQGGAIDMRVGTGKTLIIENTTIANNTASVGAGGIHWGTNAASTTNITNSTITGNTSYSADSTAGVGGGGMQNSNTAAAAAMTLNLNSTILAGNYAYNGRHDASFGTIVTVNANYSLIGVSDTFAFNDGGSNKLGTQASPLSPNLGNLVRSSGGTGVLRPNPGSLAINNGDPSITSGFDQRGMNRANGTVDIGAVEIQSAANEPANTSTSLANVTAAGSSYNFDVTYELDGGNIGFGTLGNDDVVVVYPNGTVSNCTFNGSTPGADAGTIVAHYSMDSLPGGSWDTADYGTYTLILAKDAVKTAAGASLNSGIIGTFNARVGTQYNVLNTGDNAGVNPAIGAGTGTLRQAIVDANASATLGTADTIVFDSSLNGSTIGLANALPTIADSVTITGPGSSLLTLQRIIASSTFTFLPMNQAVGNATVTISGLTLKGSTAGSALITTSDEWVTLNDVTITGNTVSTASNTSGGQIFAGSTAAMTMGRLTLNNCTISGCRSNSTASPAGANGGAINVQNGGTLTLNNTTIANNTASGTGNGVGQGGGIAFTNTVAGLLTSGLSVSNSTISGNTSNNGATAGSGGGGIFFNGLISADGVLIRNSTIANNVAASGTALGGTGGGIAFRIIGGTARIQNSTITGNTSTNTSATPGMGGGGVAFASVSPLVGATGTLAIESCIISGNASNASNGQDDLSILVAANAFATSSHDAIGDPDGFTFTSTPTADLSTANSAIGLLKLNPFQINSPGTTKTFTLQAGSTAISAGSNPSPALTVDQNGNPRVAGPQIDIGATEHIIGPPIATIGALPNVTADNGTTNPYTFTITYLAENLMNHLTIGDATEVTVTPTGGSQINAVFDHADSTVDAQQIVATYKISPPGGTWDSADNNTYTVGILGNSVYDTDGQPVVANPSMGSFSVAFPQTFTVTNTSDSDPGSLRAAIIAANTDTPGTVDTIVFDTAGVFATPQTITLASQINITDGVIINGLTGDSGRVTISGNNAIRIFNIDDSTAANIPVSISNLNLANTTASTRGGAIVVNNEVLTMTDCSITNSTCSTNAGAIAAVPGGTGCVITLVRGTFNNNKATIGGVADLGAGNTTLNATDCTFSNNVATTSGGVFGAGFPQLNLTGSTFSGNSSAGAGGVIQLANGTAGTGITITNCTLSGNTATIGGVINASSYTALLKLNIRNSTITGNLSNSSSGNGGAIFWANTGTSSTFTLNSTILAGNTVVNTLGTASPDIRFNTTGAWSTLFGDNNLIGVSDSSSNMTIPGGTNVLCTGTKAAPVNPLLLPLAGKGGLTQTHALIPGSLAVDNGSNISPTLSTDQRGGSYSRTENGFVDIGAFERVQGVPMAVPTTFTPITPGSLPDDPHTIVVTYANEVAIDTGSFGDNNVIVTGPNDYSQHATYISFAPNATNPDATDVTYTIPAPAGGWIGSYPNLYTVTVQGGSVTSNSQSVPTTAVGTIAVLIPVNFAVTNTNDSGTGSLRQAILNANALVGTADTIVFALPVFSTPQTITLTTGEIAITDDLLVDGTGANLLTVSGNGTSRIFNIGNANSLLTVTIQDMELTGASNAGAGGAILSANEVVTLDGLWFTGNVAATGGGVNMSQGSTGGGTLNIRNSTFSGNVGTTNGGGVYLQCQTNPTTLSVLNSTISGNSATGVTGLGGGICLSNSSTTTSVTLNNSTFANNSAVTGGGFRGSSTSTTTITVNSTVFDGNTAGTGPSLALVTVNSSYSALGTSGSFVQGGSTADIPTGTPLNLGPLQDNGGLMPTHLPGSGSPLIDAGTNPTGLSLDQRGLTREVGTIDIGSVEVQSSTPTWDGTAVQVNVDDATPGQRSRLTTIDVGFTSAVTPGDFAAIPINLFRYRSLGSASTAPGPYATDDTVSNQASVTGDGLITVAASPLGANFIRLTFSVVGDPSPSAINASHSVDAGSLGDGYWQLQIGSAGAILATADNEDTLSPTDANLRRFFGDFNNDSQVNGNDFTFFGTSLGLSTADPTFKTGFDYNFDGFVNGNDLTFFGTRLGQQLY